MGTGKLDTSAERGVGVAETKVCGTCKERKPLTEFARNRAELDGRQRVCKTCDNARRGVRRAWFEAPRRVQRRVELIVRLGGCCVECGESDPARLEFDHIHPATKVTTIARLLDTGSWERILEEVAKCQLLCIGCHKLKTRRERQARTLAASPE